MRRYIIAIALTALAVVTTVLSNRAHAEPVYDKCGLWAKDALGTTYDRLESGMHPVLVLHLAMTDPTIGGRGRWILAQFIDTWEVAAALDRHLVRDTAITLGMRMCNAKSVTPLEPRVTQRIKYPEI